MGRQEDGDFFFCFAVCFSDRFVRGLRFLLVISSAAAAAVKKSRVIRTNSMSLFSLNELRVCCRAFLIKIQSFTVDLNLNKRINTSADAL